MKAEDCVVTSPLSRSFDIAGKHLTITVFKGILVDDDWHFEVIDANGNKDFSDEMFETDQDALAAALRTVS
jgi:hypothetical protein